MTPDARRLGVDLVEVDLNADPELLRPPCPRRGSPTCLELYTHLRAMRACLWLAGFQRDEQRRTACALLNGLEGVWGGTTDDERRVMRASRSAGAVA